MAHAIVTFGAIIGLLFSVVVLLLEVHNEHSNQL
jgi:LPS O-antigen subunit length determinant protein (WzzB/FepE family)